MPGRHVVVIGASAGGLDPLRDVVGGLPANFPAPVCVVLHTSPQSPSVLHKILGGFAALPAISPSNGERLLDGRIYVAPPNYHLLIEPGHLRISDGPRENRFRPAIDVLFRSAAQVYGPGAIGAILSGSLDDGAAGLLAIKQLGGIAIVQDPSDALFPAMPENALAFVSVDHVVPLRDIAPLLVRLTASSSAPRPTTHDAMFRR
jgi:two-component system chemotaxis response regulator CheB